MQSEEKKQPHNKALQEEAFRSEVLAERISELEEENEDLREAIGEVVSSPAYRLSVPARRLVKHVRRQVTRVTNQGSVSGVIRKLKEKREEKKAKLAFGTKSFPSDAVRLEEASHVFADPPHFSILVPLYNTPERFLRDMIESVLMQTYQNWELVLADASDEAHTYVGDVVKEYIEHEKKLRDGHFRIVYVRLKENGGISENTNCALAEASGDYIGLLDHDDILHPEILYLYAEQITQNGADYLYCDEATFSGASVDHIVTAHFKPDYAPDTLRANNYICHFSVLKRTLIGDGPLLQKKYDGSQDHDMILRMTQRAGKIVHVPRILYYWRSHAQSTASSIDAKTYAIEAARGAVADSLQRDGFHNFRITSTRAFETIFKISYEIEGTPLVSVVIPSRDHATDLKRCVESIVMNSTWDHYEIVVVENGSTEEKTTELYKEFASDEYGGRVRIVHYLTPETDAGEASFSFSAVVNYGVSAAKGEYVILLNNDTEVVTPNWIEEMLMYAQRKDIGAVGAKLVFPDKTVQHAGIILGLGAHRTAGHAHYGKPKENFGYMGRLCYAQNLSAVTGACMMVKKSLYEEMKGFDEAFAVSLNDVDFCLRLREKGYLILFTPFAVLTHYESKSRGKDDKGANAVRYGQEAQAFKERWKAVLDAGDPYYNPNFTLDKADFSLKIPVTYTQTEVGP
ncbi:MAG: glycosyltransferase [Lachnospiraceae bacterium]|nr:glycosyltransferase [Lachnospiraceae bacterium]